MISHLSIANDKKLKSIVSQSGFKLKTMTSNKNTENINSKLLIRNTQSAVNYSSPEEEEIPSLKKDHRETILQVANPDVKEVIHSEEYQRYADFDIDRALKEIDMLKGYKHVGMLS